jgi:hypothetical protein
MPKAHRRVFLTFSRLPLVSLFSEFIFAFAWVVRLVFCSGARVGGGGKAEEDFDGNRGGLALRIKSGRCRMRLFEEEFREFT